MSNLAKRMKFATKDVLVLTVEVGESLGREGHRVAPRFAFAVDSNREKLDFVEWFVSKQYTGLFEGAMPFGGYVTTATSSMPRMLYFEANYPDYDDDERAFPIGSDEDKLALFELISTGKLGTILGGDCMAGVRLRMVKARFHMNEEKTVKALDAKLPTELAEKIVASALADDDEEDVA